MVFDEQVEEVNDRSTIAILECLAHQLAQRNQDAQRGLVLRIEPSNI